VAGALCAHELAWIILFVSALVNSDPRPLELYTGTVGVAFLLAMSATEIFFAARIVRLLASTEPLFRTWRIIAGAAFCRLSGLVLIHLLGPHHPALKTAGYYFAVPIPLVALGIALWTVLRLHRKLDNFRPTVRDYLALAAVGAHAAFFFAAVCIVWIVQGSIDWSTFIGWAMYPLLSLVLIEAVALRRATLRMGDGIIGRCWISYTFAILLTVLADVSQWLVSFGLLPEAASPIAWLLWFPAAAAYALAPIWQYQAIQYALHRSESAVAGSLEFK
jgi:hypothetical protein